MSPGTAGAVQAARNPFGSWLLGPADQSLRALRVRMQLLLTVILLTTHSIGAGVVVVLSTFVFAQETPEADMALALFIAIPVYVGLALVLGAVRGTRGTLKALRWATRGEEPTPRDRLRTLRVPLRLTLLQAGLWLAAVVLFTLLSALLQPSRAVSTGLTVAIAGLVVCAVAYLLTEFTLRPIAARALTGDTSARRPRGLGVGGRLLTFWLLGTGAPVVGLMVAAVLALTDGVSTTRLAVEVLVLGGVVLVFGLLVTVLNARSVVAPIESVRRAIAQVRTGDLSQRVPVYDGSELGLLQAGFNEMADGLREREHLRDVFGRHVGRDVAEAAAAGDLELGGASRVVTVLFVDLVGSTSMAADREPAEVVDVLNRFFSVVVDEVGAHGGFVNKFMGDAVLAVFGAPVELPDHAARALAAGRAMAQRLAEEQTDVAAGIGVYTGETVAGNVGTTDRLEYTVIGDAVNAAARLTELAKEVDGGLLTSWETVEAAGGEEGARWRRHGRAVLRGRTVETTLAVPADLA
ncbi:adenylate/guanylate cyclase domain-containing protein [Nocardioides kribbensis]|uniref:Adenylate/guanylate cyclase domain-containing protein n=1 Tax=Nocardioides kribbensis TaxID=305517 RepID=A0ABV1P0C4_9ACTN